MAIENVGAVGNVGGIDTSNERAAFDNIPEAKDESSKRSNDTTDKVGSEDAEDDTEEHDSSTGEGNESSEEEPEEQTETTEESDDESEEQEVSDSLIDQIKAANPKLLKEIPGLRAVIFREQQFTGIFPSVDEAKEAKERSELLTNFENDISSGNSATLLDALEGQSKDTLNEFLANFIPTVKEKSKELYFNLIAPEFKEMLRHYAGNADENIAQSAKNIHYTLFGDSKLDAHVGLKPGKKDEKSEALTKREQEFEKRQYESFAKDVSTVATRRLKFEISKAFKDSDLSQVFKDALTDKIFAQVNDAVSSDKRHLGNMTNLWKQAKAAGYTTDKKDSVINAFLSRAKVLIPQYRQKVLSEAKVSAKDKTQQVNKKEPIRVTSSNINSQKSNGQKVDSKKVDWSKTSERDMLDGNITLKG